MTGNSYSADEVAEVRPTAYAAGRFQPSMDAAMVSRAASSSSGVVQAAVMSASLAQPAGAAWR